MVRKLALSSLFFNSSDTSQSQRHSSPRSMSASFSTAASWQWPSCTQARTLSFRGDSAEVASMRSVNNYRQEEYKTSMNPAYALDAAERHCSGSDSSGSLLSTAPEPAAAADDDADEVVLRGIRSDRNSRLFFEPESTSSIVSKQEAAAAAAFDGATALAIDSADPYGDFRRSMEEMVMSHGVSDWRWLEEMLGWYLSANGKKTHGLIVGAFVDLLVALTSAPSPASACSSNLTPRRHLLNKGKHQTE
ncbi:hypothetical protein ACP70R_010678 [Stipagrostis hirtigluma subsp. patula]